MLIFLLKIEPTIRGWFNRHVGITITLGYRGKERRRRHYIQENVSNTEAFLIHAAFWAILFPVFLLWLGTGIVLIGLIEKFILRV
jgi:hypothetical protein